LHHVAARFFAPLLVSIVTGDEHVEVWLTSDLPEPLALRGALDVVTWSGRRVHRIPLGARLRAGESRRVAKVRADACLGRSAERHDVCLFARVAGTGYVAENFATLVPWKWARLPKPRVATSLRSRARSVELVVRTDVVTPFFHAELAGTEGHFSGDWQVLRPHRIYSMRWMPHFDRGARATGLVDARRRLRVLSLYDLYDH